MASDIRRFIVGILAGVGVVFVVFGGAVFVGSADDEAVTGVRTDRTSAQVLRLPDQDESFHFVIFGDRTGGPREGVGVLRQAVVDTNLLGPDLVMTVGDLIEGYNTEAPWMEEMREYREAMEGLKMPWFPVAGNHDIYWRGEERPEREHEENYEKHFGPLWYWFAHKQCGFLVLYSDEGDPTKGPKNFNDPNQVLMSAEQLAFLRQSLEEMKGLRQVFVFLHHPRWIEGIYGKGNWEEVHKAMAEAGNVTAVFAGHIHRLRYDGERDGIAYHALATTGGHIPFEHTGLGYVHHMNLVTVREDEISVALLPVGSVVDPKQFTPEHLAELDRVRQMAPEGSSGPIELGAEGLGAGFHRAHLSNPASRPIEVTVMPDPAGGRWLLQPDHLHLRLEPGEAKPIEFSYARTAAGFGDGFSVPRLRLQADYLGEGGRVSLPEKIVTLEVALEPLEASFFEAGGSDAESNRSLRFPGGRGAGVVVPGSTVGSALGDGPFTVEAWVNPFESADRVGLVSMGGGDAGGFALSIVEGVPTFRVNAGGEVRTVAAGAPIGNSRWTHVAGVFDGASIRLYLAGHLVATAEAGGPFQSNGAALVIGAGTDRSGGLQQGFNGWLDEVRISREARYSGESFEPAARLARDAGTVLLLHGDRRLGPFVPSDADATSHGQVRGEVVDGPGVALP